MECPKCKQVVKSQAAFCQYCGTKLEQASGETPWGALPKLDTPPSQPSRIEPARAPQPAPLVSSASPVSSWVVSPYHVSTGTADQAHPPSLPGSASDTPMPHPLPQPPAASSSSHLVSKDAASRGPGHPSGCREMSSLSFIPVSRNSMMMALFLAETRWGTTH